MNGQEAATGMEHRAVAEESEYLGAVLQVPDHWWGFEALDRDRHPGVCVQELPESRQWNLLKGSGAENRTPYSAARFLVQPTATNGLTKLTAFELRPRPIRTHRLRNLFPGSVIGRLANDELIQLRDEMIRLFGR